MKRLLLASIAAALLPSAALAEDCRPAVEVAFAKQRQQKGFRFVAEMPSPEGATRMTIDYVLPDRMHQTVEAPGQPAPVQTIAIGRWAWGSQGGAWEELQPHFAQSITSHVRETLVSPPPMTAAFDCLGTVKRDGADLVAYRSGKAQDASADAAAKPLARTIYVDPASGLPVRNIVEHTDGSAPPVFDGRYTYPADITIDSPLGEPK